MTQRFRQAGAALLLSLLFAGCAAPPEDWAPLPQDTPPISAEELAATLQLSIDKRPAFWRLADGKNELRIYPGMTLLWLNGEYLHAREPIRSADGIPMVPALLAEQIQLKLGKTARVAARKPAEPGRGLTIVLDAGHGGDNIGGRGLRGTQEKEVALDITLEAARILRENGARVLLPRDRDVFVALDDRADLANRSGSQLFVSIHANAKHPDAPNLEGVEVYYPSEHDRLTSARELHPSPTRLEIVRSVRESLELARCVHDALVDGLQAKSNGVRRHANRLAVLRLTRCPAILVEVGYLTDPSEEMRLANPEYRRRAARAIAEGILAYWTRHHGQSPFSRP